MIDAKMLRSLNAALRPTRAEIAGMIQAICARKKWTRNYLAAILGIPDLRIRSTELELRDTPVVLARLIWVLYMMDTAPKKAFDPLQIATWGKVGADLVKKSVPLKGEARQALVQKLKDCVASKYKLWPKRVSKIELSRKLGIAYMLAKKLCLESGYHACDGRAKDKRKKQIRLPELLRTNSIWIHVDWRKPIRDIAQQTGASERVVKKNKARMRQLSKITLKRHLLQCGIDPERFKPIFFPPRSYLIRQRKFVKFRLDEKRNTISKRNTILFDSTSGTSEHHANAKDEAQESTPGIHEAQLQRGGGCSQVHHGPGEEVKEGQVPSENSNTEQGGASADGNGR